MPRMLFGDWLPDQPDHLAEGLATISNAYPAQYGYRPVGAWQAVTTALGSACRGATSLVSPAGRAIVFAGTAEGLYREVGGGWELIGSGYGMPADARWRFVQFGALAIATNGGDPLQSINLETSAVAALGGSPPTFRMLAVVGNFVVGGVLDGDVRTLGWSGENNAAWWTFGSRKSDYNIMADGGEITGIIGGEFGLILQRNAVRRMSYVGGNVLFRFDKIASNVGCVTVHSVAQYDRLGFWYSDNGFKMWDGAEIRPIGFGRIDRTFASRYSAADWANMSSAIDGPRNTVAWAMHDAIWVYNWLLEKWSVIDIATEIVLAGVSKTITMDEQDPLVGVNDDNVDGVGLISFDSARFQGGDPLFYVISTDHKLGSLAGDNLAASFGLRNIEVVPGRDTRVRNVRPLTDATGGMTITVEGRQRLGDTGTTADFTALNSSGVIPARARGRYIKATLAIAADEPWTYVLGVDANVAAGGGR